MLLLCVGAARLISAPSAQLLSLGARILQTCDNAIAAEQGSLVSIWVCGELVFVKVLLRERACVRQGVKAPPSSLVAECSSLPSCPDPAGSVPRAMVSTQACSGGAGCWGKWMR